MATMEEEHKKEIAALKNEHTNVLNSKEGEISSLTLQLESMSVTSTRTQEEKQEFDDLNNEMATVKNKVALKDQAVKEVAAKLMAKNVEVAQLKKQLLTKAQEWTQELEDVKA